MKAKESEAPSDMRDTCPISLQTVDHSKSRSNFLLVVFVGCLGFDGGWIVRANAGIKRPLFPTFVFPVNKRCGDPRERACTPDELSDDDLRMLCAQGNVSGAWMRAQGFDAADGPNGGCTLSAADARKLLSQSPLVNIPTRQHG
jgi:hypothetical protein